ncbi:MAG: hypothetical protein ABSF53_09680 [Terracidiphilus sp.]
MTHAIRVLGLAVSLVMLSTAAAFAQSTTDEAIASAATVSPVAHVYLQTTNGVNLYDAATNGKLTLVKGSPFKTVGGMLGSTGKYFFTLGAEWIHVYPVDSNGAIGDQLSEIDTENYAGGDCGTTLGGVLDHTGRYLQIELEPKYPFNNPCTDYQTYEIGKADGSLIYIGDAVVNTHAGAELGPISITGNDNFAYAVDVDFGIGYGHTPYAALIRESNGALANWSFEETDPEPPPPFEFLQWILTADPTNHLAIALGSDEYSGSPDQAYGPFRLVSYSIDSAGNISSTNDWEKMPIPAVGPTLMRMSPSGKLLAVAGGPVIGELQGPPGNLGKNGLQVFHFNGANPITPYSKTLTSAPIGYMQWDNSNHIYALSSDFQLFVYTITPTSISESPDSPYKIPNKACNPSDFPYGCPNGLVVVSM